MQLSEVEKKVLMLAMDRGAHSGEVASAAVKLIELLRKRYLSGHELVKDLEAIPRTEVRYIGSTPNPYANFVLPFGKHKGKSLRQVPVDYLLWVLDNFDGLRESTREVIEEYLDR